MKVDRLSAIQRMEIRRKDLQDSLPTLELNAVKERDANTKHALTLLQECEAKLRAGEDPYNTMQNTWMTRGFHSTAKTALDSAKKKINEYNHAIGLLALSTEKTIAVNDRTNLAYLLQ